MILLYPAEVNVVNQWKLKAKSHEKTILAKYV